MIERAEPPLLSATLSPGDENEYREAQYVVKLDNFSTPLVSPYSARAFVSAAQIDLKERQKVASNHRLDPIVGGKYEFTSSSSTWQCDFTFSMENRPRYRNTLIFDMVVVVLKGLAAWSSHQSHSSLLGHADIILYRHGEHLAQGKFMCPTSQINSQLDIGSRQGNTSTTRSFVTVNSSTPRLGVEDWEYAARDILALFYDEHPPALDRATVSDAVAAAAVNIAEERRGRAPNGLVRDGHFTYSYHGVYIQIEGRRQRLNFATVEFILHGIRAYTQAHQELLQTEIVVHRKGYMVAEGALKRTPADVTESA